MFRYIAAGFLAMFSIIITYVSNKVFRYSAIPAVIVPIILISQGADISDTALAALLWYCAALVTSGLGIVLGIGMGILAAGLTDD